MSEKILGSQREGKLFVISAPAGTGKSTLVDMLLEEFPDCIAESCSATTRPPRLGEISEKHYAFVSDEQFDKMIKSGEFLEHAALFGYRYGTPKKQIETLQKAGKHVILVIDTQGAIQIQKANMAATYIFISPPSMEELRRRLFKRKTEDEEKIEERLKWAMTELERISTYDYHIVNDDLAVTYKILQSILIAEEHKM